jgi:hypothetical protein
MDQIPLAASQLRYVIILLFGLVSSLPMILIFLPPKDQSSRLSAL